jgi:hypothetical protein
MFGRVGSWEPAARGVFNLPSGRLVRGRGLRNGTPAGTPPEFGLYLQGRLPTPTPWPWRWVRWRDWWLPTDFGDADDAIRELYQRATDERVEVACTGGRGRTGTVLACLAVLDGVPAQDAVAYVRSHYQSHAVETPWQRAFVHRFQP